MWHAIVLMDLLVMAIDSISILEGPLISSLMLTHWPLRNVSIILRL